MHLLKNKKDSVQYAKQVVEVKDMVARQYIHN